jgi:hypothetical protein
MRTFSDKLKLRSSPSSNGDDGDAAVAAQHLSSLLKAPPPATMVEAGRCFYTDAVAKEEKTKRKKKERSKNKVPKFKFI